MLEIKYPTEGESAESISQCWDSAPRQASGSGYLHALFEAQVDAHRDAVALVCGPRSLTYAELETGANRLANYLRQLGAGPGSCVGLAFDRSELPIIAILACLKAGAAYVPIDPTHPDERIRYIVEEAAIALVLSERLLFERIARVFSGRIVTLDATAEIAAQPATRLSSAETGLAPDDLCYLIYTSGTTGRPKGVMTEHRNAFHFVRAFNKVCTTSPSDRIFQGFALGFDGSVEEIWMAFSNGATLLVGTKDTPKFGNDLARFLAEQGVTYFSTVPTMLSTMTEPVPSLRQLVVSGEVCPPEMVARWATPGRVMLNVYGPTEATVNTTAAICRPGHPITIGRPLAGYETVVLDAEMRPLPPGDKGELYIGGPGISRGYRKRPDLTERSFVVSHDGARLYRTGDLARVNQNGEIEYFGRLDSQVKIRGYRVELAEIEAILFEQPHVAGAVVHLSESAGTQSLAAYVALDHSSATLDREAILGALRARLPAYMVPSFLDVVDSFPMLASGKVDRKRLPAPKEVLIEEAGAGAPPATPLETKIADVWAAVFRVPRIGVEQDFFLDLGGHSLIAAQVAAVMRSRADLHLAVRDVYSYPTVRRLAAYLEQQATTAAATSAQTSTDKSSAVTGPVQNTPSRATTILQAFTIFVFLSVLVAPLIVVLPLADDLLRGRTTIIDTAAVLIPFFLALWPATLALSIGGKWLIIGRYRAGAYPLWGSYYIRWWLTARLQALSGAAALAGTPLMSVYYRLMGARVGRHCALDTPLCSIFDLVTIGDDTSIGADTQLLGCRIENGQLIIGRTDIGSRCFIGAHSALGLDVRMGDDARLDDQSLLPDGASIAAGEQRRGAPAQAADVPLPDGEPRRASFAQQALFTALAIVIGYALGLVSASPGIGVLLLWLNAFQNGWLALMILVAVAAVPLFVVVTCLWIAMLKAILLHRAKPGVYPLYSFYYLRHWLAYGLMRASRGLLLPLFTTLYLPPWMRLLGAKIGAHAEMSTVFCFTPELLAAGDGSFFADGCYLGGRRTYGGCFELAAIRVGRRSFVGNSAILPPGAGLGDDCLLGVLSMPPSHGRATPDGSDWLGSPAFRLPNRQKVGGFDERTTFRPTRKLYAQRAFVDACRVLIPSYTGFALGLGGLAAILYSYETYGLWAALGLAPFLGLGIGALAVAVVVTLKWAVMGTFKPVIVPLWCPYVWLNEMVNGAYESIMAPVVALCFGTPFAAPLLRLLGCRIGRHCYIGTSLFSEFDLVQIGNHVALNGGAIIQNHLFEDRIMKSSYLRIDDGCSVGNMAVVLYDGCMERGAVLGPLSLLMKGEIVPAGTRWHGIPTVGA
jgi:non-ribosomal peptide synthetase-like protein